MPYNSWRGFTTQSRYSVIFDPNPGAELIVEEPLKALSFRIVSGTVRQQLDLTVLPNFCPSFSFNNEALVYSAGPFGTFTIESGGTFVSDCNDDIIFHSGTISPLLFDLQAGGQLIFEGIAPKMEVANFQLNGTLVFRGSTGTKSFLSTTFLDAGVPNQIHNLELQSNNNLTLPNSLSFSGDFIKIGTGDFIGTNTHLTAIGTYEQHIPEISLQDFTLSKSNSDLIIQGDLHVIRNLYMNSGSLDLNSNNLEINSSGTGGLNYSGGSWKNISTFNYLNFPALLTPINATFPFEDQTNGGLRKVQLLGTTAEENLNINFTQYLGAEYNSSFNDNDGTPILYRLFSYIQFSGLTPSTNLLEMRISADQLIVDDVDDLRIVGTGYAAPGTHLSGLDPVDLWARRSISINDLSGINFTIGSNRTLSILPVEILSFEANWKNQLALISWKITLEGEVKIELFKSKKSVSNWEKVTEIRSGFDSKQEFHTFDPSASPYENTYYQLKITGQSQSKFSSKVIRLAPFFPIDSKIKISPNPYSSGPLFIQIPPEFELHETFVQVVLINGELIFESPYHSSEISEKLIRLPKGLYIVRFFNDEKIQFIRWVHR